METALIYWIDIWEKQNCWQFNFVLETIAKNKKNNKTKKIIDQNWYSICVLLRRRGENIGNVFGKWYVVLCYVCVFVCSARMLCWNETTYNFGSLNNNNKKTEFENMRMFELFIYKITRGSVSLYSSGIKT